MNYIDVAKGLKQDEEVIIKVKNEIIRGNINIDANLGIGYFFNDDINSKKFLPVYDSMKQGVEGRTVILNKRNIEWLSANIDSDPSRDCILPGGYNPITVTVTLRDTLFVGEINLGYHKRLSDRLNDIENHFIPLLNVEYHGRNRTIFINMDAILSVYDEIESHNDNDLVVAPYEDERLFALTDSKKERVLTVNGTIPPVTRLFSMPPQSRKSVGTNDFVFKRA